MSEKTICDICKLDVKIFNKEYFCYYISMRGSVNNYKKNLDICYSCHEHLVSFINKKIKGE